MEHRQSTRIGPASYGGHAVSACVLPRSELLRLSMAGPAIGTWRSLACRLEWAGATFHGMNGGHEQGAYELIPTASGTLHARRHTVPFTMSCTLHEIRSPMPM